MKKITTILVLTLVLTFTALAYNAPLEAANFVSAIPETYTEEDGLLELSVAKSAYLDNVDDDGYVYTEKNGGGDKVFIPTDAFDVILRYVDGNEPTGGLAGYDYKLFFNPEVVRILLLGDKSYANLYNVLSKKYPISDDFWLLSEATTGSAADYALYMQETDEALKAEKLTSYENSYKKGFDTAVVAAQGPTALTGWSKAYLNNDGEGYDLVRWSLNEVDLTNNNWYRTKLYIDYNDGDVGSASNSSMYPGVEAPAYYYNPDYTGPKFDIIGGMKKADGALRFGSVYFLGDEYFDNDAEILEAGVVCYPSELLEDKVLTLKTEGALKIPATGYKSLTEKEMTYTGVITGLPEDMYITAKSYITYMVEDEETGEPVAVTVYSDPIARKLATADTAEMK